MNARPIVLPGITTGLVLLAAMVGFVQLPAEGQTSATGGAKPADISMCRSVLSNAAQLDLERQLDAAGDKVADGKVPEAESAELLSVLNTILSPISQSNMVTDPSLSKAAQAPLSDFFATSVRGLIGAQNTNTLTEGDVKGIQSTFGDLKKACDSIDV